MATLQGKNGVLRFYDGTRGRDLDESQIRVSAQPLTTNTRRIYVGQVFQFSKIMVVLSGAAEKAGALVVEYWNGRTWVWVSGIIDGTMVGTDTMSRSGVVSWNIPSDWMADGLFYIRLRVSNTPSVAPVVQQIEPCSGQFLSLTFSSIKIVGPQGRPRPQEIIAERVRWIDRPVFVQGPMDQSPLIINISCVLESTIDEMTVLKAMSGGNPKIDTWILPGISTKTLSWLPNGDGAVSSTKGFADSSGKTVDVQAKWCDDNYNSGYWEWREMYFDLEHQGIFEKSLNITGACYGSINNNRISSFGLETAA